MLWNMTLIAVTFMAAGATLRDFIREPNWFDVFWFVLFFGFGTFQLLVLIGTVLQDTRATTYV